jgi:hypothetical protein
MGKRWSGEVEANRGGTFRVMDVVGCLLPGKRPFETLSTSEDNRRIANLMAVVVAASST